MSAQNFVTLKLNSYFYFWREGIILKKKKSTTLMSLKDMFRLEHKPSEMNHKVINYKVNQN